MSHKPWEPASCSRPGQTHDPLCTARQTHLWVLGPGPIQSSGPLAGPHHSPGARASLAAWPSQVDSASSLRPGNPAMAWVHCLSSCRRGPLTANPNARPVLQLPARLHGRSSARSWLRRQPQELDDLRLSLSTCGRCCLLPLDPPTWSSGSSTREHVRKTKSQTPPQTHWLRIRFYQDFR